MTWWTSALAPRDPRVSGPPLQTRSRASPPVSAEPGQTFGRVAEAYARTRPPYSRAAIERAARELGLTNDSTVLDLAAGTGNLTRALREQFAHVVAVEPDAGDACAVRGRGARRHG